MSGTPLSPDEKNPKRIVQAVNQLLQGRSNAVSVVTLRPGHTTTVVSGQNIGADSEIFFTAKSAHAAALTPQPYVAAGDVKLGSFTITHPNSAQTDLTFGWEARG